MSTRYKLIILFSVAALSLVAQENTNQSKFKQLYEELPTPNVYRTASGAPGHQYYQQKADYVIDVELDEKNHTIKGNETVTYTNNSPDALDYLWVQLDQNIRAKNSIGQLTSTSSIDSEMSFGSIKRMHDKMNFDGGFKLDHVTDASGNKLSYTVNETMMRIDLPRPLRKGQSFSFKIKYWYNINDRMKLGGRSGYEYFEEEDNSIYSIAQFFPRMAVYNEVDGWQNKQFLGNGEFTLPFGDYKVNITVPADHIVAATGELKNASSLLSNAQRKRWESSRTSFNEPVIIVTQEEAEASEKEKSPSKKTWTFEAKNVRDFGWASSRKFIWDAMAVKISGKTVMAYSFYPKEGNPLWEQYSTRVVAHTLKTYSKFTTDYTYPQATSIHTKRIGMEYPMICFNYGRPEEDGTYSKRTKYGMIGVIIHEVGHNFFPMIINSDERQWTWMDEGLNTFVQYLTQEEFERGYPSRRGPPQNIVSYMKGDKSGISPIMINSESILQFGNNAYGKPATALNILRETIMGRELFDHAFKTYSERWAFKHPTPADFFRTMEDASAVDLDWFWRGWFYTNDHVDISLDQVSWFKVSTGNPEVENPIAKANEEKDDTYIGGTRNKILIEKTVDELDEKSIDFYTTYDPFLTSILEKEDYTEYIEDLEEQELALLSDGKNYYELQFSNIGGLVMPIILEFEYTDGSKEVVRIPAEIWVQNSESITKVFILDKEVARVTLDPLLETADVDRNNNYWPPRMEPTRFELYKAKDKSKDNLMQKEVKAQEREEEIKKEAEEKDAEEENTEEPAEDK
ncbi:MAG: M1 family metallopeptidase [Flavobacteriales bacterium]|nr:M1 family metallopeptidase [Flavobacteriales bacterium]